MKSAPHKFLTGAGASTFSSSSFFCGAANVCIFTGSSLGVFSILYPGGSVKHANRKHAMRPSDVERITVGPRGKSPAPPSDGFNMAPHEAP